MKRFLVCLLLAFFTMASYAQDTYTPEQIKELKQQAKKNDVEAQYTLACCYMDGNGIKKDEKKAVEWFGKAVEQGHEMAMYRLGVCYIKGIGMKKADWTKGEQLLEKAGRAGIPEAQYEMGLHYKERAEYASGKAASSHRKTAYGWFHYAAMNNYRPAYFYYAYACANGWSGSKDYSEAFTWYKKDAEAGDIWSQNNLALLYENGRGVKQDKARAFYWYTRAAEGGNMNAAKNLGICYENGIGTEKDFAEAAKWYEKAATDYDTAKMLLGGLYEAGKGVEKDEKKAFELYNQASGLANAKYRIGRCYEDGIGVKASKSKALDWYEKAAAEGNTAADNAYRILKYSGKLQPEEKDGFLVRSAKMVEDLWEVFVKEKVTPRYLYPYYGDGDAREVFLDQLPEKYRSSLESELLECYKSVFIIKDTPNWYYVVDDDDCVGIYTLKGEVFCLPIPGKIRMIRGGFHFMLLGDVTADKVFDEQLKPFLASALGTPIGLGKAVVQWKKGEYIVPYGPYTTVSFTRRMTTNSYYVSQIVDGELKWGLLDKDGSVEIPVQYTGVGVEGGHFLVGQAVQLIGGEFVGRNDKTIDEMTNYNYERYYRKLEIQQALASTLMEVGNTLMAVANALPDTSPSGVSASATSGQGSASGSGSKQGAKKGEDIIGSKTGIKSMRELTTNQNRRQVYSSCERELIHMSVFREYYSEASRKEFQRIMREARQEEEARGHKMRHSAWEDWDGGTPPARP